MSEIFKDLTLKNASSEYLRAERTLSMNGEEKKNVRLKEPILLGYKMTVPLLFFFTQKIYNKPKNKKNAGNYRAMA